MALMNFNGTIAIDEDAAAQDIQKISQAREILGECGKTVDSIIAQSQEMNGKASESISNKAVQLKKKLMYLMDNLENSENCIRNTVQKYIEIDKQYAESIRQLQQK